MSYYQQCCLQYQLICCLYTPYRSSSCCPYPPVYPQQPTIPYRLDVTIIPPSERIVNEGNPVEFACQGNGKVIDSSYQWKWYKDNQEILPSGIRVYFGYLNIPNVRKIHAGRYQCQVEWLGVKGFAEANLIVTTPTVPIRPNITSRVEVQMIPQQQTVEEGRSAEFQCRLKGHSDAQVKYKWTIGHRHRHQRIKISNGHLTISKVTLGDEGNYTCRVEISNKIISATGKLTVTPRKEVVLVAVIDVFINGKLKQNPKETVSINKGAKVLLKCRSSSGPSGIFTFDDGPAGGDVSAEVKTPKLVKNDSQVVIDHFNHASQLRYTCAISNGQSATIDLICHGRC